MKRYQTFVYHSFDFKQVKNNLNIGYHFEIQPDFHFYPKVIVPLPNPPTGGQVNNLIFNLGLVEMLSYWKATCSPKIIIKAGYLNKQQIAWWRDLILKGMGQYFFENKIDFTQKNFITIDTDHNQPIPLEEQPTLNSQKVLIPIGGGKDSLVTWKLFKKTNYLPHALVLTGPHNPANNAIKIAELIDKQAIIVQRIIDPLLFKLNMKGFLNGHTPFSAYLAFLSILVAYLYNIGQVVVSNESSSNEGNVRYLNKVINHQYSKSFEFETKFRQYLSDFLLDNLNFYSVLRPLNELQITKLFSRYPKYFKLFKSCNINQSKNSWCSQCPKCLFTFIALVPFLGLNKTIQIFGKNLLIDKNLLPIKQKLLGLKDFKPFECVGTHQEANAAYEMIKNGQSQLFQQLLTVWNKQNYLPKDVTNILKDEINRP